MFYVYLYTTPECSAVVSVDLIPWLTVGPHRLKFFLVNILLHSSYIEYILTPTLENINFKTATLGKALVNTTLFLNTVTGLVDSD